MMLSYSNCTDVWRASECHIIAGGLRMNFLQYDCLLKGYTALRVFSLQASFGLYGSWKTWNFIVAFSRTGKSWTKATGSGNVLNSRQKSEMYGRH